MRAVLALVASALFASTGWAQSDGVVRGVGTASCAEYAIIYKSNPQAAERDFGGWAQGFMSGMNVQLGIEGRPRRAVPPPVTHDLALRRICDERPLIPYIKAVLDYFQTLPMAR
jgi:hypothetical protein